MPIALGAIRLVLAKISQQKIIVPKVALKLVLARFILLVLLVIIFRTASALGAKIRTAVRQLAHSAMLQQIVLAATTKTAILV